LLANAPSSIRPDASAIPRNSGRLARSLRRKAGYITGQNILLDGGAFPGTL